MHGSEDVRNYYADFINVKFYYDFISVMSSRPDDYHLLGDDAVWLL
jgi:hypothetical protein